MWHNGLGAGLLVQRLYQSVHRRHYIESTTMVEDCVAQADALNVCPTNYISFAYNDNDGHSWCDCCGESWTPDSNDYGSPAPDETGGTYFCE